MEDVDFAHHALPAMHAGYPQRAVDIMLHECQGRPDLVIARFRILLLARQPVADVTRLMSPVMNELRPA
jgi:hypothetical protein